MTDVRRNWDPEVESPATIAILGGGPIAIETALYARFLGYYVELFERHRVAGRVTAWETTSMPITLSESTTSLGRAALLAQNPDTDLGDLSRCPTFREWGELYLLPLARTDLIHDSVHVQTTVKSVSRLVTGFGSPCTAQARANDQFRILATSNNRGDWTSLADIVIDCTGWNRISVGSSAGGGWAIGEEALRDQIVTRIPRQDQIRSGHWLVWGSSHDALEAIRRLCQEVERYPELRLTWFIPRLDGTVSAIQEIENLAENRLSQFALVPCLGTEAIARSESGKWMVRMTMPDETTIDVQGDHFVSLPHPVRDRQWELMLAESWSEMAEGEDSDSESQSNANWPGWKFATNEPHFYVLGSKGFNSAEAAIQGEWPAMQSSIRDLFSLLGNRRELDLYADFLKREQDSTQ